MSCAEPIINAVHRNNADDPLAVPQLFFPPFPRLPKNASLMPYDQWNGHGVWVGTSDSLVPLSILDAYGLPAVPHGAILDSDQERQVADDKAKERKLRQLQKAKLGVRLVREDCWKLGTVQGWSEPDGTSRSDFNERIPPFTRLVSATRDFLNSRHEEFQFNRSKRLMDSVRNAFGLRTEIKGPHVNGTGSDGEIYEPPYSGRTRDHVPSTHDIYSGRTDTEEICVLLTKPVTAVRGFLAMARRDAEAGWDLAPALKLTEITATFLSFIEHHKVVPEISDDIQAAAQLARGAYELILQSKTFEDVLLDGLGINRASWTVFGGEWGGAERGGMEKEGEVRVPEEPFEGSDGGWRVDIVVDNRPEHVPAAEAAQAMNKFIPNSSGCGMLGYVPFSRRKVTAVHDPNADAAPGSLESMFWRVDTVAAPWTIEENWRHVQIVEYSDSDDETSSLNTSVEELEKENATIAEPNVLTIFCDLSGFSRPESLVGCGLRGRWALFGTDDGEKWWAFKAKDYVLPAFWQSAEAHRGGEQGSM